MLSVIIETCNDEEALARTLASLVSGAVEGLVRDVVVCDLGSGDATRQVAEHAGCVWTTGGIADAVTTAKGDWLLLLEPGARLLGDWTEAVAVHAARSGAAARFSRDRSSRAPFLARILSRPGPLAQGLLLPRRQAVVLARHADSAAALARGLSMKTLRAAILPAARKEKKSSDHYSSRAVAP
ncbi:MAG: glycosyl transferase family 2 [Aquamicrobium sp.]|nr:glycosyl transferase family 2 [Aquamicrobium sp.]MCK9553901.1 glycosyl transferase family 2 [Aquamicrobium sp.]